MRTLLLWACAAAPAFAQYKAANPEVAKIVSEVSEGRITEIVKKLESFGTRNLLSTEDHPTRGIGAARQWIYEQFRSYSPRLEVSFDEHRLKKIEGEASTVPRDVNLYNVVAVLPGKEGNHQRIIVSAHYDTKVTTPPGRDPDLDEPGVTDDASGVACVMELARIFSQYEFDKTLVFIAFAGEEEGMLGSTLYAEKARNDEQKIEAVLNNDIIGTEISGSGRAENRRVNVFSDDPPDSPARQVARYVKDMAERYLPSMKADLVFRADRIGRGGDHTPFALEGFGAVRLSSPQETLANEHSITDTFANTSVPYIGRVTRVNAAVAASLAWAPKPPQTMTTSERDGRKTQAPMLTRGESRNDAKLQWNQDDPEPDLIGYVVVMRATTAPYWEREIFVGDVTEYTLPDVSIDDVVFGVKAIDKDGNESLVSPYTPPPRQKRKVEAY